MNFVMKLMQQLKLIVPIFLLKTIFTLLMEITVKLLFVLADY
jgi:hypothetical protein